MLGIGVRGRSKGLPPSSGMKILYLSLAQIPSRSAHSIHIMRMCSALSANGQNVTLVVPGGGNDLPSELEMLALYGIETPFEIDFRKLSKHRGRSTRFLLHTLKRFRQEDGELVYTRDVAAAFWAVTLNLATVLETHSVLNSTKDKLMFRGVHRRGKLKTHVVISKRLRDIFDAKYPQSSRKRLVAHDGADRIVPVTDVRSEINLDGDFKVGYVGHLYAGRGLELIADLARRLPSIVFYVVGGTDEDIAIWRKKIGNQKNICMMGYLKYSLAERVRVACDVLIAPYQRGLEVFGGGTDTTDWMSPLKIFEYMAAGKPIVCSDLPALREILTHGETAFLLDPNDLDGWANTLQMLRNNENLGMSIGSAARKELEEKYEWRVRAKRVLANLPS